MKTKKNMHHGAQMLLVMLSMLMVSCASPRTGDKPVPLYKDDGKFAINVWESDLAKADKTKPQSLTTNPVRDAALTEAINLGGVLLEGTIRDRLSQTGGKVSVDVQPE